jgi:hypothetical protein
MVTLTKDKEKLFYFLREVHELCKNETPFSFNALMHKHNVYGNETREALKRVKLFEPTGEKKGRTPYHRWLAPVQPNIETATKLDEEIKKLRRQKHSRQVKGNGHNKKEAVQPINVKAIKYEKAYDNKGVEKNKESESKNNPDAFVIRIPKTYIYSFYSLGKYLLAAGAGYVIRLIIEKL